MSKKEQLLSITTYEEFNRRREEFRGLELDEDIKNIFQKYFQNVMEKTKNSIRLVQSLGRKRLLENSYQSEMAGGIFENFCEEEYTWLEMIIL